MPGPGVPSHHDADDVGQGVELLLPEPDLALPLHESLVRNRRATLHVPAGRDGGLAPGGVRGAGVPAGGGHVTKQGLVGVSHAADDVEAVEALPLALGSHFVEDLLCGLVAAELRHDPFGPPDEQHGLVVNLHVGGVLEVVLHPVWEEVVHHVVPGLHALGATILPHDAEPEHVEVLGLQQAVMDGVAEGVLDIRAPVAPIPAIDEGLDAMLQSVLDVPVGHLRGALVIPPDGRLAFRPRLDLPPPVVCAELPQRAVVHQHGVVGARGPWLGHISSFREVEWRGELEVNAGFSWPEACG